MIYASRKLNDLSFVRGLLDANRFTTIPLPSGLRQFSLFFSSERWKRTGDYYPWGAVMYLSNFEEDKHATVVLVGAFHPDSGTVVDHDGTAQFLASEVPWYEELARAAVATREIPVPPPCVGYHATDADPEDVKRTCNGGVNPETAAEEPPCSWRTHCILFGRHCAAAHREPQDLLEGLGPEAVLQTVLQAVQSQGTIREDLAAATGLTLPNVAPGTDVGQRWRQMTDTVLQLITNFSVEVNRTVARERASARPGDLFIVDHREKSNYLALYLKPAEGQAPPIFTAKFKPQTMRLALQFPLPPEHPAVRQVGKAKPMKIGRFRSELRVEVPRMLLLVPLLHVIFQDALALPPIKADRSAAAQE